MDHARTQREAGRGKGIRCEKWANFNETKSSLSENDRGPDLTRRRTRLCPILHSAPLFILPLLRVWPPTDRLTQPLSKSLIPLLLIIHVFPLQQWAEIEKYRFLPRERETCLRSRNGGGGGGGPHQVGNSNSFGMSPGRDCCCCFGFLSSKSVTVRSRRRDFDSGTS